MISLRIIFFFFFLSVFNQIISQADSLYLKTYTGVKNDTAWCPHDSIYNPYAFNNSWDIKFGYMYSLKFYHIGEIGIKKTYYYGGARHSSDFQGTFGPSCAIDFLVKNKTFLVGPKVGFEIEYLIIGGKVNVICYTKEFLKADLKIRPEGGISIAGIISLYYGYSFGLIDNNVMQQNHTLSFSYNIPFRGYYNKRRIQNFLMEKRK
jgi:hypothetical protein